MSLDKTAMKQPAATTTAMTDTMISIIALLNLTSGFTLQPSLDNSLPMHGMDALKRIKM